MNVVDNTRHGALTLTLTSKPNINSLSNLINSFLMNSQPIRRI